MTAAIRFGLVQPVHFIDKTTKEVVPYDPAYHEIVKTQMGRKTHTIFGVQNEPELPDGCYVVTDGPSDSDHWDFDLRWTRLAAKDMSKTGGFFDDSAIFSRTPAQPPILGPKTAHHEDYKGLYREFISKAGDSLIVEVPFTEDQEFDAWLLSHNKNK